MRFTKRWAKRLRSLVRREAVERELEEELEFHLEMEVQKNRALGMSAEEARRQAVLAFGGVEKHKEEVREARWLGWLDGLSLDARLGARMLLKYPGLTLVGGLGMAVAIAVAAVFEGTAGASLATLPLEDGDRIVALEVWDAEINNQEPQILHDLATWREELRSVEALGAYRPITRNLIIPGGSAEPVQLVEMTSSGFGVAGVAPLMGRPLAQEDEEEGAVAVVVLGHDLWESRFAGDRAVVGREVRLGNTVHTVVGVMPEGFGFPVNQRLWTPLRLNAASYAPRAGPRINVFGRLAPGATLEGAQAELTTLGRRTAAASPETHRHLRPRVIPYGPHLLDDLQGWEVPFARFLVTLLLVVICVNVAVLVFARTATRAGEITVRSALGASRRRIVTQLFAEALVLSLVAAAVGVGLAGYSLRRLEGVMDGLLAPMGGLPYWIEFDLSSTAVLHVVALTVLAAAIVGVVPALQATGSRLESALRSLGGATGMRLGRMWTVMIVAQVAFAVAILPATLSYGSQMVRYGTVDPGFPAEEYLTTRLLMERETPAPGAEAVDPATFDAQFTDRVAELATRLQRRPELRAATFTLDVPTDEMGVRFSVDDPWAGSESRKSHAVRFNRVDLAFFDAFELPVLAGRTFEQRDLGPGSTAVVVDLAFADEVLGGGDPVGRRIRFAEGYRTGGVVVAPEGVDPKIWYEIVGVVGDLPPNRMDPDGPYGHTYFPLAPGMYPLTLIMRTRGAPADFAPVLRSMAAAVDPTLQASALVPLDAIVRVLQDGMRMGALALWLLTGSVLLLSAAGIYALMSFTVTRRRREIGIRSALGAPPRRILRGVFARAAAQLGLGAGIGLGMAILFNFATGGDFTMGSGGIVLPAVAAIMLGVGLMAALGPARRGLRISPSEALKADA